MSLHSVGRAVDIRGNPRCAYAMLRDWPGGVSVDYGRVGHIHFSYDPHGGREMHARFSHGGHRRRRARRTADRGRCLVQLGLTQPWLQPTT